jgi:hypothetical protein
MRKRPNSATSSLSPQKDESRDEPESTSAGMENAPSPDHAARFGRSSLRRRIHELPVGRHDYEYRVGPICEQDDGPEQPTPFEGAEKRDQPEDSADNGEARLHHVAALVGQLPLGKERAIIELKARGLLGDVDVDRSSCEYGGYRERKLTGKYFLFLGPRRQCLGPVLMRREPNRCGRRNRSALRTRACRICLSSHAIINGNKPMMGSSVSEPMHATVARCF